MFQVIELEVTVTYARFRSDFQTALLPFANKQVTVTF